jgi:hypothetical protein
MGQEQLHGILLRGQGQFSVSGSDPIGEPGDIVPGIRVMIWKYTEIDWLDPQIGQRLAECLGIANPTKAHGAKGWQLGQRDWVLLMDGGSARGMSHFHPGKRPTTNGFGSFSDCEAFRGRDLIRARENHDVRSP